MKRAKALRSGVRAGPAKYSIIRIVTGFALVGLHDQSLATAAEELVAEIPPRAIANDAITAAALRLVMSLDTMVPLLSPSEMKRFIHVNGESTGKC